MATISEKREELAQFLMEWVMDVQTGSCGEPSLADLQLCGNLHQVLEDHLDAKMVPSPLKQKSVGEIIDEEITLFAMRHLEG